MELEVLPNRVKFYIWNEKSEFFVFWLWACFAIFTTSSLLTVKHELYVIVNVLLYWSLADELLAEKEKYKGISEELDQTFAELAGF